MLLWFCETKVTKKAESLSWFSAFFYAPPKKLYELFGKGEFFLYLCCEITRTIPIPLL
jgi:hypothetical protein